MAETLQLSFNYKNQRYQDAQAGLRAVAKDLGVSVEKITPVLRAELEKFLNAVAKAMARVHGSPWPGGTTPKTLSKRSGKGIQSILKSVKVRGSKLDNIEGRIGGSAIMAVHEYGATITAKKAKYLTIPLPAALRPNGTPKKPKARDWPNTFVAKSKAGNLLIFQRRGKKIVPLYVLKRQVKIPPRLGMRRTLEAQIPFFVDTASQAMLREFIKT